MPNLKYTPRYANFRNAKIIKVIKIEVNEGDGTTEDPFVRVAYLTSLSGKVLAKIGDDIEREFVGTDEMIILK
jgi:hypothetical protein